MMMLLKFLCLLILCGSLPVFSAGDRDSSRSPAPPRLRWDEFPCPEEDDVTVVLDQGWDLDSTFFNSDGDIVIYLDIRRYLGTPEEISLQKVLGLLPSHVRLYLPAYDVDIHGSEYNDCAPEQDDVYFNGRKIGRLTGDDEIWHLHEFSIPFNQVKFPDAPGSFARNEIRVKVDVGNSDSNWCTKIDWVALTFHAPRPVLMVHGLNSDGSSWNEMQAILSEELGIPSEALDVDGRGSIHGNARMISDFLNSSCHYGGAGLKRYYHVKEFNIIAHSKGGLDSRYYVSSRGLGADDIENLLQIATPNGGCELAEKFYTKDEEAWKIRKIYQTAGLLGIRACQATQDLRPRYMKQFNLCHPLSSTQTKIAVLAGRITNWPGGAGWVDRIMQNIFNFLANVSYRNEAGRTPLGNHYLNGDGIVSVASAHALKNAVSGSPLTSPMANHLDITTKMAPACISHFTSRLCQIVYPKYQGEKSSKRSRLAPEPAEMPTESPQTESTGSWTAAGDADREEVMETLFVEPGRQTAFPLQLREKQDLEIMLMEADKNLGVELILPDGKSMTPKSHPGQFHYAEDLTGNGTAPDFLFFGNTGNFLYLKVPDAAPGLHLLKLDGAGLKAVRNYHLMTMIKGKVWNLEARLRKENLSTDEPFVIEARILDPGGAVIRKPEQQLTARIREQRRLEDEGRLVSLSDDGRGPDLKAGDGIFTAAVRMTKGALYDIFVKAGKAVREKQDSRVLSLTGTRSDGTALILQEIRETYLDANGNGLYDKLMLEGRIRTTAPGIYWIDADLMTDDRTTLQHCIAKIECRSEGIYDFQLEFSGQTIFNSRKDGPYVLGNLALTREIDGVLLPRDKPVWNYHTQPKNHLLFEHQPLFFLQTGAVQNRDKNGDGLIDSIEIGLNLLVADGFQGDYTWSANLLAEDGMAIANSHGSGKLEKTDDPGNPQVISLQFPCNQIAAGHYRGPFEIQMVTMDNHSTGKVEAFPCNYKTRAYTPFEFIKEANIIDATDKVNMAFSPWTIDRSTGAMASEITLTNRSAPGDKPLDLVFRLAIPADPDTRLCRIDGRTADGTEYMDVTAEIERQLLCTGNRDYKFDAGEQVKITVPIFSRKRRIPDPKIYSFWADPPPDDQKKPVLPQQFFLDENQDMKIDDWEMLRGMNLWYNLRLNDAELSRLIKIWQAGSYIRNEAGCSFDPGDS